MADARVPGFEEVPTFKEQGHDWSIAGWRGIALTRLADAGEEAAHSAGSSRLRPALLVMAAALF